MRVLFIITSIRTRVFRKKKPGKPLAPETREEREPGEAPSPPETGGASAPRTPCLVWVNNFFSRRREALLASPLSYGKLENLIRTMFYSKRRSGLGYRIRGQPLAPPSVILHRKLETLMPMFHSERQWNILRNKGGSPLTPPPII